MSDEHGFHLFAKVILMEAPTVHSPSLNGRDGNDNVPGKGQVSGFRMSLSAIEKCMEEVGNGLFKLMTTFGKSLYFGNLRVCLIQASAFY